VVDQGLSKGAIFIPCNKTLTSEDTARLLLEHLYKRFGLPDKIISDRGPQFASKSFIELLKLLGIKSALSTAYHPQTDGTTEHVNHEIEVYLSIYCASHPEDWPRALHTLEFTHNIRRHADRPFELILGESPVAIPLSFEATKYPNVEDKMKTPTKQRGSISGTWTGKKPDGWTMEIKLYSVQERRPSMARFLKPEDDDEQGGYLDLEIAKWTLLRNFEAIGCLSRSIN
jgi:hypothetical protein